MPTFTLLYFALAALNIAIAWGVLLARPTNLANRAFAFFGFSVGLWVSAIALAYNPATHNIAYVRLTFSASSLMLLGLLTLLQVFPNYRFPWRNPLYLTLATAHTLACVLAHTPLIVSKAKLEQSAPVLIYGSYHKPFTVIVYLTLATCLSLLLSRLHSASGFTRLQLRYLLLGLLIPGLAVTVTNLLLPLITGASHFGRYGPAFSVVFLAFTAHALIRQRLLDIRVVITRTVAYALATITTAAAFIAGALILARTLPSLRTLPDYSLFLLPLFLLALLFQPAKATFEHVINRYVYRTAYDYPRVLRELTREITARLDLSSLLAYVTPVLDSAFRPEYVAIYLTPLGSADFHLQELRHHGLTQSTSLPLRLLVDHPLCLRLSQHPSVILPHEVLSSPSSIALQATLIELRRLAADCVQPFSDEHGLLGFVLLGRKLSGDPYFPQDLDLLSTLAGHLTIALRNGHLYQEVRRVSDRLQHILTTMHSGVLVAGVDGTISLTNLAALAYILPAGASSSPPRIEHLPAVLATELDATLSDGKSRLNVEAQILSPQYGLLPIIYSTSALKDSRGAITGASVVFSDVSKMKRLEQENRQIEHLASVGALAAGIAHEVKNPLVAIRTFAELLPDRYNDPDFRNDFSRVVTTEIERITHLIDRLRGVPAPHTPHVVLDIRDVVADVLTLLRGQFEQRDISITSATSGERFFIRGNPQHLKQFFLNLILNSLDSMQHRGSLAISFCHEVDLLAGKILVEIADNGSGIPETVLTRIHEPFFTTKIAGSGLGLSICQGIAEAHSASLRITNHPSGCGAIASVWFPAVDSSIRELGDQNVAFSDSGQVCGETGEAQKTNSNADKCSTRQLQMFEHSPSSERC